MQKLKRKTELITGTNSGIGVLTAELFLTKIPLQRFGSSEDVASAALFLASPENTFLTGTDIKVDIAKAQHSNIWRRRSG